MDAMTVLLSDSLWTKRLYSMPGDRVDRFQGSLNASRFENRGENLAWLHEPDFRMAI
jgi:hypothetical protein